MVNQELLKRLKLVHHAILLKPLDIFIAFIKLLHRFKIKGVPPLLGLLLRLTLALLNFRDDQQHMLERNRTLSLGL